MAEPYETPPSMQDIYDKDKERYKESDRLIEEGDLKGAAEVHPDREKLRNNLIASIGLETGVGITADFLTSPLLVSPIPGSRPLYYGLNYGIGYGTNWLAQKIRGNETFDQGEALAAGGFQTIPFGTTAKGFKGISRAALKGSTGAVVGEQVRVGIDEQRFLNPEETLSAAVAGGLIGGTLKGVGEANYLAKKLHQQIKVNKPRDINQELKELVQVSLTGPKDLDLYGAKPSQFKVYENLDAAINEPLDRGIRRAKVGDFYYTIHRKKGEIIATPYNKWYQQTINPFKIPKDLEAQWKAAESGQQLDITESGGKLVEVQYGTKGKTRLVKQPIRYPKGTVVEFKKWYKNLFDLQTTERQLMRKLSILAEKADLVEARVPGKKFFELDRSHIVPRSRGGSGLTFLEAWMANQRRGNQWILNPEALDKAGIPKNWDELFNAWLAAKAAKKSGTTILETGLGPLDNINVDDYFAVEQGEALAIVARRRNNIRNLVNRQIGNPDTAMLKGDNGTIADDYRLMVLESKGYDQFDDPKLHNPKILDIGYAAENYENLVELGEL